MYVRFLFQLETPWAPHQLLKMPATTSPHGSKETAAAKKQEAHPADGTISNKAVKAGKLKITGGDEPDGFSSGDEVEKAELDDSVKLPSWKAPSKISQAAPKQGDLKAANKLQKSLMGLVPWNRRENGEGAARNRALSPDRGSSPPSFILNLTATWEGCQGVSSCAAADVGFKVALWTVDSPETPAALVLYDPRKRKYGEGGGDTP